MSGCLKWPFGWKHDRSDGRWMLRKGWKRERLIHHAKVPWMHRRIAHARHDQDGHQEDRAVVIRWVFSGCWYRARECCCQSWSTPSPRFTVAIFCGVGWRYGWEEKRCWPRNDRHGSHPARWWPCPCLGSDEHAKGARVALDSLLNTFMKTCSFSLTTFPFHSSWFSSLCLFGSPSIRLSTHTVDWVCKNVSPHQERLDDLCPCGWLDRSCFLLPLWLSCLVRLPSWVNTHCRPSKSRIWDPRRLGDAHAKVATNVQRILQHDRSKPSRLGWVRIKKTNSSNVLKTFNTSCFSLSPKSIRDQNRLVKTPLQENVDDKHSTLLKTAFYMQGDIKRTKELMSAQ